MAVPKDSLVADIYSELVKIRRLGLDANAVQKHGEKLVKLPCVTAELATWAESTGRPGEPSDYDLAAAAVSVIECAVAYGIQRRVYRVILRRTLHIAGFQGRGEWSDETPTVPERLTFALWDLRWSPLKQKRAEEKMVEAYTELASFLVRSRVTPCRSGGNPARLDIELEQYLNEAVDSATQLLRMARILSGLGFEIDFDARDALARELLEIVPKGAERVQGVDPAPVHRVRALARAVAYTYYERAMVSAPEPRELMLSAGGIEKVIVLGGYADQPIAEEDGFTSSSEYFEARRNSLDLLAAGLIQAENDGWIILDDPNDRARLLRI